MDDQLRLFFFDELNLSLLTIPRENIPIGDLYIGQESGQALVSIGNFKWLLDPPLEISEMSQKRGIGADLTIGNSNEIPKNLILAFLETYLNALIPNGAGTRLRAECEKKAVKKIQLTLASITLEDTDVAMLAGRVTEHKMLTNHPLLSIKDSRYYLIIGLARCPKVKVVAKDIESNFVDIDMYAIVTSNLISDGAIERTREGEFVFTSKRNLIFAVQLIEIEPDFRTGNFRFKPIDRDVAVR